MSVAHKACLSVPSTGTGRYWYWVKSEPVSPCGEQAPGEDNRLDDSQEHLSQSSHSKILKVDAKF